jgi:hypothetical protein
MAQVAYEPHTIAVTGVVCVIGFALFRRYILGYFRSAGGSLPPGPAGYPIIGNLLQLDKKRPHEQFTAWSKLYGDMFTLNVLGKKLVVLNSTEVIREAFASEPYSAVFSGRPPTFVGKYVMHNYDDMAMASYGEHWVRRRRLVQRVVNSSVDGIGADTSDQSCYTKALERIQAFGSSPFDPADIVTSSVCCWVAQMVS